ncbi:ubiquitin ligase SCF complex subunit Cullin, partial [Coprinopsis sp. MPI-PUGE-AT-0042]
LKHGPDFSAEKTWLALSNNIREIQNHNAASLSFEENYRYAYNMVLYKEGEMLYRGIGNLIADNLEHLAAEQINPRFPAGSINDPIQRTQAGELLLKALRQVWDDHVSNMTKIGQLLKYMDRIYTKANNVPETWEKGLELFLKHIIRSPIKDHLVTAILNQIEFERDGHGINRSAVKGCVDVFLWLETPQSTVYKQELEPVFLKESERFYKQESKTLLETCGAPEYLKRVQARFDSEDSRIHHYLSPQTQSALTQILLDTLLTPHLTAVLSMPNSGLEVMIDANKIEDLSRLYLLFSKVPAGLPAINQSLRESIIRRGKEINGISLGAGTAEADAEPAQNKGKAKAPPRDAALVAAVKWVQDVLDLKDRFDRIWKEAFNNDRDVEASMNEAFGAFVNSNEKAPEFTSLFIDSHLKSGLKGKSDDEVDAVLGKTITIFRYISDKDVFERYYKTHLAKRLLHGRSVSDDAERGMLAKMKLESGYQFTLKLEGMFKDMKTSADAMDAYHEWVKNRTTPPVDLNVTVMTTTLWPISPPTVQCLVPPILAETRRSFETFYFSRHSGRQLTWSMALGNADVKARFKQRVHDLNVSTYALVILLLFEDLGDSDFLTYEEIKSATSIDDHELKRNLQSLACARFRILKKHPAGRDVLDDDSFSFNDDFSAPMQKIKISTVSSKPETMQERQETKGRIDEERKYQIDAAIVRVMKDRKHMTHNLLVTEVTRQLTARFQPNPMVIKQRIESLIEKEYLERSEDDKKAYNYVVCAT